jgi:hypothetical protein
MRGSSAGFEQKLRQPSESFLKLDQDQFGIPEFEPEGRLIRINISNARERKTILDIRRIWAGFYRCIQVI